MIVVSLGGKKALRPRVPDAVTRAMITREDNVVLSKSRGMEEAEGRKRLTAVTTFGILESQTLHHITRQDVLLSSPEKAEASVEIDYAPVNEESDSQVGQKEKKKKRKT